MLDKKTYEAVKENGLRGAARVLGRSRGAISSELAGAVARGELVLAQEASKPRPSWSYRESEAAKRIRELERQLADERAAIEVALEMVNEPVRDVQITLDKMPPTPGTSRAVVLLGDWHYGEVVRRDEVCGANEYSTDIAKKRVSRVVDRIIDICSSHMSGTEISGATVFVLGDMVSGDIHDELRDTNERPLIEVALECRDLAAWALQELARYFGRMEVHWVYGNHGRTTRKPRAKLAYAYNFDWLIGSMVARDLNKMDRVSVNVPKSGDALADVCGLRILGTHGDRLGVKGGDGIIGAIGPIMRGHMKTSASMASYGLNYDLLVMGHWHQVLWLPSVIVNGSIKGTDEYGIISRARGATPSQALFFVHSERGITARWEIHAS